MQRMMQRMGISMNEIKAEQVIIKCADKEIIIDNPQIVVTKVQGQDMYQVSGDMREEAGGEVRLEFSDDDVKMVAEQAKVSEKKAKEALEKAGGDLAQAIMDLKK